MIDDVPSCRRTTKITRTHQDTFIEPIQYKYNINWIRTELRTYMDNGMASCGRLYPRGYMWVPFCIIQCNMEECSGISCSVHTLNYVRYAKLNYSQILIQTRRTVRVRGYSKKFTADVVRGRLFNFGRSFENRWFGIWYVKNNKIIGSVWDLWAELEPFLRQFSHIESSGTLVNWKLVFLDADSAIIIGIFIKMEGTFIFG